MLHWSLELALAPSRSGQSSSASFSPLSWHFHWSGHSCEEHRPDCLTLTFPGHASAINLVATEDGNSTAAQGQAQAPTGSSLLDMRQ